LEHLQLSTRLNLDSRSYTSMKEVYIYFHWRLKTGQDMISSKMAVFWVKTSCRLVWVYPRFRDPYCIHEQGDDSSPW
jgi:hypothetical protein